MVSKLYETMEADLGMCKDTRNTSLRDKMLTGMWREYVIDKVKAPLYKAIILAAKLLPAKPTKENCHWRNTHIVMDIFDRFLEDFTWENRKDLFKAARDILVSEIEHDPAYASILSYFAEAIAVEIEKGNWMKNSSKDKFIGLWKEGIFKEVKDGDS